MGCSSCGAVSNIGQVQRIVRRDIAKEDCIYTSDILNDWLTTLKCAKTKNLLVQSKLNSYIGIVQSSINYSSNPCYFKIKLDEISITIDNIKTGDQC